MGRHPPQIWGDRPPALTNRIQANECRGPSSYFSIGNLINFNQVFCAFSTMRRVSSTH